MRYVNNAIIALIIATIVIGAVTGGVAAAQAAITVNTDKDVYRPGEVVVITGTAPALGPVVYKPPTEAPKPSPLSILHDKYSSVRWY